MNDTEQNQPAILDWPTIDAMLQERGVVRTDANFHVSRVLGVSFDTEDAQEAMVKGTDSLLEFKDNILRDLDTRLTKILEL